MMTTTNMREGQDMEHQERKYKVDSVKEISSDE